MRRVPANGCRQRRAASASWIRRGHPAAEVALEPGFPRIGLINGRRLVEPLVEHWNDIPQEFQQWLGLKPGLVRI